MTTALRSGAFLALCFALAASPAVAETLRVVATVPDLADLAQTVGGDAVSVTALVRGPQDAHFVEPRPSFIRTLHDADLLIRVGMELEVGWLPTLLQSARNPALQPGAEGHLDASTAIVPLEVPAAGVDRSMGDVHPYGNPHYLSDPLNGLRVARLIAERLARLRPAEAAQFEARRDAFTRGLLERLVGVALAGATTPDALETALARDELDALAAELGVPVGGWLGTLRSARGTPVVQDHRLWPYFARRFGLVPVMELEPRPGIAPTTAHVAAVVERVEAQKIPLILASSYFDSRTAERVAERTGARVVVLAHQVGAREGTDDYLATIEYNVRQVSGAL